MDCHAYVFAFAQTRELIRFTLKNQYFLAKEPLTKTHYL